MKGERVRQFFNSETKALLALHKNIETFIPSSKKKGAGHVAEEGRYIESILRNFLNKHLPDDLKAYSGFILRPATKTGNHNRTRRKKEVDQHSQQLDIIVYDHKNYPVFESFEEFAIVPTEGVISIISVKKNLYENQIENEIKSLQHTAKLCHIKTHDKKFMCGPNTCLFSFSNKVKPKKQFKEVVEYFYSKIAATHTDVNFDQCIGQIISLDSYTIFKKRPNSETEFNKKAEYVAFNHSTENEYHFGLQFLLTGILAAYYHETRKQELRPVFTSFPTDRKHDIVLGELDIDKLR
jgi:hypothetical protein